jgi:hypothetical protein
MSGYYVTDTGDTCNRPRGDHGRLYSALMPARDGSVFCGTIEQLPDTLEILSNRGKCYRSAHRDYAMAHGYSTKVDELSWINSGGAHVVLTVWQ